MFLEINVYLTIITLFIFIIMYYIMIIYPQKKIQYKYINMIKNININKYVCLKNGIIGKIIKNSEKKYITLLINKKTKILVDKKYISYIIKKENILDKI